MIAVMFLPILIIFISIFMLTIGRKLNPSLSLSKAIIRLYGGVILVLSVLALSFIYPKILAHENQVKGKVEPVDYWEVDDMPEAYKEREEEIPFEDDELIVNSDDFYYKFPNIYVIEEERDNILLETYQLPTVFGSIDMTDKMPVMDVKIEDKTLLIQEEKVDQIKTSYYSIGNDLITNQFKQNPENEEEWADFYDGEYIVILHLPHHISVKDDGIVTFIDEKSSMN